MYVKDIRAGLVELQGKLVPGAVKDLELASFHACARFPYGILYTYNKRVFNKFLYEKAHIQKNLWCWKV